GKTTLAKAISEKLGIHYIEEHFDDHIDRRNIQTKAPKQWGEELVGILNAKIQIEDSLEGFVSDRCPLDLLHFWCHYRLEAKFSQKTNQRFFNKCIKRARSYDFIVFPPWGSFPMEQVGSERPKV